MVATGLTSFALAAAVASALSEHTLATESIAFPICLLLIMSPK